MYIKKKFILILRTRLPKLLISILEYYILIYNSVAGRIQRRIDTEAL